jgi:hypothetical protein
MSHDRDWLLVAGHLGLTRETRVWRDAALDVNLSRVRVASSQREHEPARRVLELCGNQRAKQAPALTPARAPTRAPGPRESTEAIWVRSYRQLGERIAQPSPGSPPERSSGGGQPLVGLPTTSRRLRTPTLSNTERM